MLLYVLGSYEVSYNSPASGTYSLEVTLQGHHINGSPFLVQVDPGKQRPQLQQQ